MNSILCFIDKQENYSSALEEYILKLDKTGCRLYLHTDIIMQKGVPSDVLYYLDTIIDETKTQTQNRFTFLTNMRDLMQLVYRIYHQVFDYFIYFYQQQADSYLLKGVYQDIIGIKILDSEKLHKGIYTNSSEFKISNYESNPYELETFIADISENNLSSRIQLDEYEHRICGDHPELELIKKIFYVNGEYYLFEPCVTDNVIVINDFVYDGDNKLNVAINKKYFYYPNFMSTKYIYLFNEKLISKLLSLTEQLSYNSMVETYELLYTLEEELSGYHSYTYNMTCCVLDDISLNHTGKDILRALLLVSFLMQITKKPYYMNRFIKYATESNVLSCENRFYLWNQAKRYLLTSRACGDSNTDILMKALYEKIYHEYKAQLENDLTPIPLKERNIDTIAVFTIQFLSDRHAPTRTTLERCYTLSKLLNKNIILINTREQLTSRGMLPLYMSTLGNVMDEYNEIKYYQYKDCEFPYYQPDDNMPSVDGIKNIIHKIRQLKPSFIFSIGNGSIIADLCGNIVPQASIGVAFSLLPTTMATFSVIGKTLSELEWENYLKKGYSRQSIIESTFTFELLPKKKSFTRKEFGIPENDFVLVTVGIRLDTEIDDTYIKNVIATFKWGTHIVFAGYFDRYASYCEKYPELMEHSTFIGYCNDILALMEICDLYVNPKRLGGGFSIIEAFHEGKPGVTIDYGDIATAAGKLFTVNDYQEMTEIIKKYMDDKEFYQRMSEEAIAREKILTDSASAMINIIDKIQNSPLFF